MVESYVRTDTCSLSAKLFDAYWVLRNCRPIVKCAWLLSTPNDCWGCSCISASAESALLISSVNAQGTSLFKNSVFAKNKSSIGL